MVMIMKTLKEKLELKKPLVSDGAWGTFLQKQGLQPGECPELWCVTRPDVVRNIADSYIAAGSDMIETNSFGANRFKLKYFNLENRVSEINESAAAISRKSAGADKHVLGSMGPTGKILLMGDVSEEELYDAFSEQAKALERGGVDACCVETMTALDEATLAIRAVKENTKLEVICTFTFDKNAKSFATIMGVTPAEMTRTILEAGADIVGTNCGNGMEDMTAIVKQIRAESSETPILVHANAGRPIVENNVTTFPETPEEMARHALETVKAGADIIGGCCGTTPEHIKSIIKALREK